MSLLLNQITGEGIHDSLGQVESVSEQTGLATVTLQPPTDGEHQPPRYSDTVQVPVSRIKPLRTEVNIANRIKLKFELRKLFA